MANREPLLRPIPIAELRPTQMTVGYREVAEKRRRWREYDGEAKKAFLSSNVTGTIGGFPLTGTADLSPWVFSVGMGLHF